MDQTADILLKSTLSRGKEMPPGISYEFAPGQFGLDSFLPASPRIDEARMSIVIPFADGRNRDGVGDLLEVGGIDLSRHQSNPIALFDHGKNVVLPIGMAEDPVSRLYTVNIDQQARSADADTFFYQGKGMEGVNADDEYHHAVFCQQLFHLMAKRFVRGGSIGYTVTAARELPPDRNNGTPKGLHLLAVKMLELSAVVLPANQDTVTKSLRHFRHGMSETAREILAMRSVAGNPLSCHLIKSLTPFVTDTKAVSGYASKGMPITAGEKGDHAKHLKGLRKKYRPVKGLRRTMKKGVPGSAIIFVDRKNHDQIQALADQRGVTLKWLAQVPHGMKLRLTGPDDGIDAIAKDFGLPLPAAGKSLNHQGKAMNEDTGIERLTGTDPDTLEDMEEPYEAQVHRRLHEDSSLLLHDYDRMMKRTVHEPTKARLQSLLEHHAGHLDELEKDFPNHFPDLPGLGEGGEPEGDADAEVTPEEVAEEEGETPEEQAIEEATGEELPGDEDTMDDAAIGASSDPAREEEEPTEEEAFAASTKALRRKYGQKMCGKCEDEITGKRGVKRDYFDGSDEWRGGSGTGMTHVAEEQGSGTYTPTRTPTRREANRAVSQRGRHLGGGVRGPDMERSRTGGVNTASPAVDTSVPDGKAMHGLHDHEVGPYSEATGFLGELSQPGSHLDDEGRMKSFHYHKTLGGIAQLRAEALEDRGDEEEVHDKDLDSEHAAASQQAKESLDQVQALGRPAAPKSMRQHKKAADSTPATPAGWESVGTGTPGGNANARPNKQQTPRPAGGSKSLAGARDAAGAAADFFGKLATEKAFGDPHRKECGRHHMAMKAFLPEDDSDAEDEPVEEMEGDGQDWELADDPASEMAEEDITPEEEAAAAADLGDGEELDAKQEKALKATLAKRAEQLETLTKTLNTLNGAFRGRN